MEGNEFKVFKVGNWVGWLGVEYGLVCVGGEYLIFDILCFDLIDEVDYVDCEVF